jgi:hypothetical protein
MVILSRIFVKLIFEKSARKTCRAAPRNKQFVSLIKTNNLIQCREIIAVCVDISHLTKHINPLYLWQMSFLYKTCWHIKWPVGFKLLLISAVIMQKKTENRKAE